MGKQEKEVRIRTRNSKITRAILITLAVAVAGTLNPQALVRGVLRELKKGVKANRSTQNSVYAARGRLMRQGLIVFKNGYFELTERGRSTLRMFGKGLEHFKKRRWDKKWRILIFDIKEKRRNTRDQIRRTLVALGFIRLQDSVWVYPHDCEDLIALLKIDFRIGKDLLYIIADSVENDMWLRSRFGFS